ncbi:MAG: hypothetical protein FD124_1561 [Alphaproteobacteria bacterium]|nr:MAG: hypothetical protein FD160_1940 [Caulobacteraceae bacterium]TPW06761.1 MAG: hypothetical protein FD124_1561 [Alphaproteobacteria bacterium]
MHETPNVVRTRGYLPHVEGGGYVQHVVFRVLDAMPPESDGVSFDDERARLLAIERWLDTGHGRCPLALEAAADVVVDTLNHFAGARYALHAFVVMPNHVHALVEPFREHALSAIVHSWKSFTAKRINALDGRSGPFWAREWYDRFMRDDAHFHQTMKYIERNPVVAGLCEAPEAWRWSSAARRSAGAR